MNSLKSGTFWACSVLILLDVEDEDAVPESEVEHNLVLSCSASDALVEEEDNVGDGAMGRGGEADNEEVDENGEDDDEIECVPVRLVLLVNMG